MKKICLIFLIMFLLSGCKDNDIVCTYSNEDIDYKVTITSYDDVISDVSLSVSTSAENTGDPRTKQYKASLPTELLENLATKKIKETFPNIEKFKGSSSIEDNIYKYEINASNLDDNLYIMTEKVQGLKERGFICE